MKFTFKNFKIERKNSCERSNYKSLRLLFNNNLPMHNLLSLIETHNTRTQSEKIAINFKYNYEALIPQKQVR